MMHLRLITATLAVACAGATAAHAQTSTPVAITGVTVVDVVAGTTRDNQTVLISGNRIAAVGPASAVRVPAGARTVQGAGRFLIPGLWDMHSHVVSYGPTSLPLYLAHGVTSLRDMGAERFAEARALRDSIAAGRLLGPRLRIAGPVVENAQWLAAVKKMGEAAGTPWTLYERFGPRSPQEAERWVDSVAALGADHIKVRNWPAPAIGRALLARARAKGLPVVAHGNEPFPREGLATLEHGIWPPLGGSREGRDSLWRQIAAAGTSFVPTLATWPIRLNPLDSSIARIRGGRIPGLQYVPRATRERWVNGFLELKQEQPMDWTGIHRGELRNLAEMRRAGITVLSGTDAGAPLVIPGVSLHDELALLVEHAALTPLEALQAATIAPARVVGAADSLGSIERGKLADLVLLDANPLVDIGNTRRIRAVIANGRVLDRAALDAMLARVAAASR